MNSKFFDAKIVIIYCMIFTVFLFSAYGFNQAVATLSEDMVQNHTVIIDAGHGGVDGGAVSCTGIYESAINLEIALCLNDLMHLLGVRTVMIRDTDRSVYTSGETIAAKKISDIRERVRIVNSTPNALLLSIHQNNFHDSRYWGTQVFYNKQPDSKELAELLQNAFRESINSKNNRSIKESSGVYLMEHSNSPSVLIECGFLSNPTEEQLLKNDIYQRKMSCVIVATVCQYLNT